MWPRGRRFPPRPRGRPTTRGPMPIPRSLRLAAVAAAACTSLAICVPAAATAAPAPRQTLLSLVRIPEKGGRLVGRRGNNGCGYPMRLTVQLPSHIGDRPRKLRHFLLKVRGLWIFRFVFGNMQYRSVLWQIGVAGCVEECKRLVIVRVTNRIVRMGMALHTIHSEAIQYGPSGRRAVHRRDQAKLFVVGAAFVIVGSLPVK